MQVSSVKPAAQRPRLERPAGVRLGVVVPRDPVVDVQPAVQAGIRRVPGHRRVVGVADGDQAAGAADPAHLDQGGDRIGQVLQHLVGVHDVEAVVGEVEGVGVTDREIDVLQALLVRRGPGGGQRGRFPVDADHPAGRDPRGQPEGDRAGPAPDVQHRRSGGQVRDQVAGGVLDRPPAVRAQHAGVVAVGVGVVGSHARILPGPDERDQADRRRTSSTTATADQPHAPDDGADGPSPASGIAQRVAARLVPRSSGGCPSGRLEFQDRRTGRCRRRRGTSPGMGRPRPVPLVGGAATGRDHPAGGPTQPAVGSRVSDTPLMQ